MATATDMFTGLEDQVLETVKQGQEAVVKAVRTWADASKNLIPDLPPLPFADQLPTTTEIVENAFAFADKLSPRSVSSSPPSSTPPSRSTARLTRPSRTVPSKATAPASKTSAAA